MSRSAWVLALYVSVIAVALAHGAGLSEPDIAFLGKHAAFPEIHASLSFEFGSADYRLGEPSAAQRISRDALLRKNGATDPADPQALIEVGDSWSRLGEDATATRWYRRALKASAVRLSESEDVPPLDDAIAYGKSLLRLGDTSRAIGVFAALSDGYPDAAGPKYHLSTALISLGDLNAAETVARELIAQHDDWLDAHTLWGSLQFGLAVSRNPPDPLADRMDVGPIRAALRRHAELDPALRWLEWNLRIAAHALQRIAERMDPSGAWNGITAADPGADELKTIRAELAPWTGAADAPAAVWKAASWLDFLAGRDEAFFDSSLELLARTYDRKEYESCILALRMLGRGDLAVRLLILKSVEYPQPQYRHMLAYLHGEAGESVQAAAALDAIPAGDPFAHMARAVLALRAGDGGAASASLARGLAAGYAASDVDYYRGLQALLEGNRNSARRHLATFRPKAAPSHHLDLLLERFPAEVRSGDERAARAR